MEDRPLFIKAESQSVSYFSFKIIILMRVHSLIFFAVSVIQAYITFRALGAALRSEECMRTMQKNYSFNRRLNISSNIIIILGIGFIAGSFYLQYSWPWILLGGLYLGLVLVLGIVRVILPPIGTEISDQNSAIEEIASKVRDKALLSVKAKSISRFVSSLVLFVLWQLWWAFLSCE